MACQAYGCLTRQRYGKSLYRFPDPEESFTSTKHKLACEDHFETSCFEGNLMVILFIFLIILNIEGLVPYCRILIFHLFEELQKNIL